GVLAAVYVQAGQLPAFDGLLRAVKPVVVVIVLQALVGLSRTALRSVPLALLALLAAVAVSLGAGEVGVLIGIGVLHAALGRRAATTATAACLAILLTTAAAAAGAAVPLPSLFAYFLKA